MLINNLSDHTRELQPVLMHAIQRVLQRGWFVLGPEVSRFEAAFAEYVGVRFCRSVANGTDALELALRAGGVIAGDVVATVANAGMYSTTALLAIGAVPRYVDILPETSLVDPVELARAIDSGVKAVIITHLYGRAVDMADIADQCRHAHVVLVEDCAQAHGAKVAGRRVGCFGDLACFSFYPTKNLGALGDGGAVVTDRPDLADAVGQLRQYGWTTKYTVSMTGGRNSRLDEIQAAVLTDLLPSLDGWNARRREIASCYTAQIEHPDVLLPNVAGEDYVAHLYVVRARRRDLLQRHLADSGIGSEVHYPVPDHRQPVVGGTMRDVVLPVTESVCREVLTLPCYPEMTDADVTRVIAAVNAWRS